MSELLRESRSVLAAATREAENGVLMDSLDNDVMLTVLDAFMAYEKALVDNDVATMDAFFVDSPSVVRFGVAEEQWGAEQVRAWRATATPVPPGRRLGETQVALHGLSTAVVTTLFRYPDSDRIGRQTQVWVNHSDDPAGARRLESWHILSAHVSERSEGVA